MSGRARNIFSYPTACAFALVLLGICLLFTIGCDSDVEIARIRIGFSPNITHSQALYARNTGLYQKVFGTMIDITWAQYNAGPPEIDAMIAGDLDIGYAGPVPAINAYVKSGGKIRVIAAAANAGSMLVTRADLRIDAGVNEARNLKGMTIAVPQFGNTQHLTLLMILRRYNLLDLKGDDRVRVVQIANARVQRSFASGTVDAALLPEPWGSLLVNDAGANILLDEKQIWRDGNYPVTLVIARQEFMDAYPRILATFLAAHSDATELIINNHAMATRIIGDEFFNLTGELLRPQELDQAMHRITLARTVDMRAMEEFRDLLTSEGFIQGSGDISGILFDSDSL